MSFIAHNYRRLSVLEKRLQTQVEEVADLTAQLKRARDTAHTATAAKEELMRKMSHTAKITQVRWCIHRFHHFSILTPLIFYIKNI